MDGTRQDENKTVIFDGEEIHRSKMTGDSTSRGVFGVPAVFPIWDWTESDVYSYLGSA
jgi:3'-phosphoadenosine 5'-phosphosulfate sulfotransferase (PAPS reductase)/FAD synthetase